MGLLLYIPVVIPVKLLIGTCQPSKSVSEKYNEVHYSLFSPRTHLDGFLQRYKEIGTEIVSTYLHVYSISTKVDWPGKRLKRLVLRRPFWMTKQIV